jgi:hypothetical protein
MARTDPLTFAESQIEIYENLLARHAGQQTVTIDGRSLTLKDLEEKYLFWSRRYEVLSGNRPRVASVTMNGE